MRKLSTLLFLIVAATFCKAQATYTYVGSFNVGDGPCWNTPTPPTYTAQEAAAFVFGGSAGSYAISVNSNSTDPATITHTAYLDGYGDTRYFGTPAAENYKAGAAYVVGAFSAFIKDHSDGNLNANTNCRYVIGTTKTNYVWRANPNTITTASLTNSPYCAGSGVSVNFTSIATFNTGNVFSVQLSNASGSFASPVVIGTLTATASAAIAAVIPPGTVADSGYRIRVVSSNPVVTGTDNGAGIRITSPTSSTQTISSCDNYLWNDVNYDSSGTYTRTGLINAAGCDSTATLILTVNRSSSSTQEVSSCNAFTWNGVEYTTSGTYTKTGLKNAAGCDSTAILILTINIPTSSTQHVTTCDSYTWNGTVYNTSGTYTKTGFRNAAGCDSIAILNLIVNHSNTGDTLVVCNRFTWYGTTFTSTGTGTHVFTNAAGCDSVVTLHFIYSTTVPVKPVVINGTFNACPTDVFTYSVPADVNVGYFNWASPFGTTILSGQGTNTVTIGFNAGFTTAGPLTVYASNCLGSSSIRSATIYPGTKPATPGSIAGPVDACPYMFAGSYALYTIDKVPGATSYNWSLSDISSSQIMSHSGTGADDTAIYVRFDAGYNSALINVTATSKCGTSSIARVLGVYGRLPVTPVVSGNSSPCPNGIETYTASVTSASVYTWTVGSTVATIISGQGTRFLTVQFKPGFVNATISVAASSVCGLSYPGKLIVTKPGFCRPELAARGVAVPKEENTALDIRIMPNPARDNFSIIINSSDKVSTAHVDIINEFGQTVYSYNDKSKSGLIKLKINNSFSNGMYLVKCTVGGDVITRRLVISR